MKSYRKHIAALLGACVLTAAAFAAEASPAGVWKWMVHGRQGQGFEQTLTLDYKDGKLSGTLQGRQGVADTSISDASFANGQVKFAVTREFNGNKFTTKYDGKLEGDAITGVFERPGMNGGTPAPSEWHATRQK